MKLSYQSVRYVSHARVARDYRRVLAERHELVPADEYAQADVVILHIEPEDYDGLYAVMPGLASKYVIAYCVWEASEIPESYRRSIQRVQEVWTCSRYCQRAYSRHHPCVQYVPHIIERDTATSDDDLASVAETIAYDPRLVYFLTIAKWWRGRKNVIGLVRAFERLRAHMPDARLIIKMRTGATHEPIDDPRIICIAEDWSDAKMNALYRLADVYASAHWAEGWGLTMSDAMVFGLPVIATGYSGNLEFMHAENSILVDYRETTIPPGDRYSRYTGDMAWAYPDEDDLARKLRWVYEARGSDEIQGRVRRARHELGRFDRQAVGRLMEERLHAVRRIAV